MGSWQSKVERGFGRVAGMACDRPPLMLFIMVIVAGLCAQSIRELRIDTSTEGFLPADDPSLVAFEA